MVRAPLSPVAADLETRSTATPGPFLEQLRAPWRRGLGVGPESGGVPSLLNVRATAQTGIPHVGGCRLSISVARRLQRVYGQGMDPLLYLGSSFTASGWDALWAACGRLSPAACTELCAAWCCPTDCPVALYDWLVGCVNEDGADSAFVLRDVRSYL